MMRTAVDSKVAANYSNDTTTSTLEERLSALLSSPDNNFSAAQYLNLALSSDTTANTTTINNDDDDGIDSDEYQILERRMASAALQLQMHTRACHDEISRIGAELHAIIPRCAADVTRLRSGLEGMEMDVRGMLSSGQERPMGDGDGLLKRMGGNKKTMHTMEELMGNNGSISTSDSRTTNPLATLRTLLTLRTHLTSTRSILAAASGWDDTMDSVPSLLATNPPDLLGAVEALVRLEAGARALHCIPGGREERDVSLRKLRSQIEAMLRPRLHHALGNMDTRLGPLRQCVEMYGALGRMTTLQEEYVRIRPAEIHALWFSFGGGGATSTSLVGKAKNGENNNGNGGEDDRNRNGAAKDEEVKDFDFNDVDDDTDSTSPNNIHAGISSKSHHKTAAPPTAKRFIEFLPTFYDAVLELLAKERTQSRTVFGPDLSSSVMARVLTECFRPITTSFGKRLNSLCPAPGKGLSASGSGNDDSGVGGMEAIAAAYDSTVRFLSLAYDQIEVWDGHSSKGKGKGSGSGAVRDNHASRDEALSLVRTSFLLIASPFVPYQRALSEAERDPMGEAATMVAKDVRGVVNFEDAAERFEYLAPFIFPLAEAAIDRFELLNSGYNALPTLSSVDKLISNHAAELAIAMGTLSTNASNNSGPEFDEQHVNCALEILRIAGLFKRNLLSFESSVRDRLMMLSKEMTELALDNAVIPDGLTPSQIRAILAREACDPSHNGAGVECPSSVLQLRRLCGSNPPALFPTALDSTARLARSCLSLVFEVCSAIPERQLRGISALPVWKQEGGASDGVDESYGVLPQPFITQVGEHMLALVQALEPFASDADALGLANEVMTGVIEVAIQPWKEFVAAAGCSFTEDGKSFLETLMRGVDLQKYFLNDEVDDHEKLENSARDLKEGGDNEDDADERASAAFCNQWLDVVGLAVTGRLLERTMRIPRLGRKGAEHLAADVNYILNVFTALGVSGHPHPLLGYVARLVTIDDQMLRSKIQSRRKEDEVSDVREVIKRVELRIAYVRSIAI